MATQAKDEAGSSAGIAAASMRVPPFWRRNPVAWFRQLEAQFTLAGVTQDATKFNHALVGLDENTVGRVADVLEVGSYQQLKEQLITRLTASESAKLNHLLTELSLGDRTPSQLLPEIKRLGGGMVSEGLLRSLWLERLPKTTQAILTCADSGSLDKLAATADKIHEVHARPVVAEVAREPSSEIAQLKETVGALAT